MRTLLRGLLLPLGIASLLAGAHFQGGNALSLRQLETPPPTVFDFGRLAEPTLPSVPSQADYGAKDYWLHCLVCHGDKGQGLTDEFRTQYPPDEQNCWQSGCHGRSPYENGFTLPTAIPPVVGPAAPLHSFANASVLYAFISSAMPWHNPSSLEPEVYWRLTAFLLRENGYENPYAELGPGNAGFIPIGAGDAVSTEELAPLPQQPTASGGADLTGHIVGDQLSKRLIVLAAIGVASGLVILQWLRKVKPKP